MDYRIEEIVNHYEKDVSRVPSISVIAQSLNISVSRFQHLFKDEMKMSFKQFVQGARMRKACFLLKTTHLRVKEITVMVGCPDETNFIRAFKQTFADTPNNYRKNHKIRHL